MSKSKFDRELKDRAVRMYHQEWGCQVVCVWGLFIGICRSGRGRPQPFG